MTSGMRTVVVDKIASVTQACGLSHEIRIATDIPCEEGLVIVVEILNNKSTYNTLELTSGRMAKIARGDVVVGALGHRKALFGYSGHIPAALKPGDVILLLSWHRQADADRFAGSVSLPEGARLRQIRVVRDYGMYDRREAPQYYPDAAGEQTLHA